MVYPILTGKPNPLLEVSIQKLSMGGSFLETLDLCNSDQLDNFTSRKNHTLDLVITNRPSFVEKCLPIPGFGDHDTAISVDVACQPKYSKPPRWEVFMWKKVDFESLKSDIRNIMTMFTTTNSIETPIDDLWTKFSKHIIDIQKRHVPSIMTSPRFSQPWITRECKRKISRKKRAYKKFKRTKLDSDWLKYQEAAKKSRKPFKNAFNTNVQLSVSPDLKSNPKKFFSFIKNKRKENIGVSPLRESTSLKFTKQDRAHILNNQFSSVFSVDDKTSPNVQGPQSDKMHEININNERITRLLKNLSSSKASRPDMISARFLKETADEVAVGLTLIFQASLHQANIPDE